jgi:cyclophilin family peptidyl-prolyl cis-trans isomerase
MKKSINAVVIIVILIVVTALGIGFLSIKQLPAGNSNSTSSNVSANSVAARNNKYPSAPQMSIDTAKQYNAVVTTNLGTFTIKLLSKDAPLTVNNFVFLAKDSFYNGITFHRIIKDFMIQTGDPLSNGTGGPGYKFADELPNKLSYGPGIVAMANSGPNTNGSQFFICTGDQASLLNNSPNYTIFGQVTEGMDVVLNIANTPVAANAAGELSKPTGNIYIQNIVVQNQ